MKSHDDSLLKYALEQGLTSQEFERICTILGRSPNKLEISLFAVMWSEHCSYKSSKPYLKKLPTSSPRVLQGPGENAGIIDIGDGLAVVFKVESHNHPSFIEPFQGAATGVGGILRDIFTMGARPVAVMDILQFGEPSDDRTPYLLNGVVGGISFYGNCMGIPTVGGRTGFHRSFNNNILVNAFCLGIVEKDKIFLARAGGEGNAVMYLGSRTGRDGIHGATMASDVFDDETEEKRPTVQVGDPFTEKLLMEASLEMMKEGLVLGIQDMGAAGLTCSTFEMASRGECGIELNLDKVPLREEGMTPEEIMLSESQERMLLVCTPENVDKISKIAEKWGLSACVVGTVVKGENVRVLWRGEEAANLPARALTEDTPVCRWKVEPVTPKALSGEELLSKISPVTDWQDLLDKFLSHPEIGSKKWITRQYDSMVGTDTVRGPGGDAACIRIKGSSKGILMSSDVNPRYCRNYPKEGTLIAVAEAARNIYCSGGRPIGITNCLNFGNPQRPEIMWQFSEAIDGLAEGARFFNAPVVSGNVSFYNETEGVSIDPTPTIVMVGLVEDVTKIPPAFFQNEGDVIYLLGKTVEEEIGLSAYLSVIYGIEEGRVPGVDLHAEKKLGEFLISIAEKKIVSCIHDCSEGGILLTLLECSFNSDDNLGFDIEAAGAVRPDAWLFSESQARAVVTIPPDLTKEFEKEISAVGIVCSRLGTVRNGACRVKDVFDLNIKELKNIWDSAVPSVAGVKES